MYRTLPALILLLLPAAAPTAQEGECRDPQAASLQRGAPRFGQRPPLHRLRPGADARRERPEGSGRGQRTPALVGALDADADGILSAQEIANAAAALLTLDANGDGRLTREELAPGLAKGREERGKHRRGGADERDREAGRAPRSES